MVRPALNFNSKTSSSPVVSLQIEMTYFELSSLLIIALTVMVGILESNHTSVHNVQRSCQQVQAGDVVVMVVNGTYMLVLVSALAFGTRMQKLKPMAQSIGKLRRRATSMFFSDHDTKDVESPEAEFVDSSHPKDENANVLEHDADHSADDRQQHGIGMLSRASKRPAFGSSESTSANESRPEEFSTEGRARIAGSSRHSEDTEGIEMLLRDSDVAATVSSFSDDLPVAPAAAEPSAQAAIASSTSSSSLWEIFKRGIKSQTRAMSDRPDEVESADAHMLTSLAVEPHTEEPDLLDDDNATQLTLPLEAAPTLSKRENSRRHTDADGNTFYETHLASGMSETSWIDPEPGLSPAPSDVADDPGQDTSRSSSNTSEGRDWPAGGGGGVWNRESFLETQSLIRQLDDAIEQDVPSLPTAADSNSMVDV